MTDQAQSEIMTVSFGTFSCTLEGAENPLETMMAVTEFFRDMVKKDQYFGAEPPMLESGPADFDKRGYGLIE